jgi:hypothetical protein
MRARVTGRSSASWARARLARGDADLVPVDGPDALSAERLDQQACYA